MRQWIGIVLGLVVATEVAWSADSGVRWENSLVSFKVTRHNYDFFQPWSRRTAENSKFGVVVGSKQILTTADHLFDATLIRVQKGGRGLWSNGVLSWLDYHANLALVTVEDEQFWEGLEPVEFADPVPTSGPAELVRWNDGRLEVRGLDLNRLFMRRGHLTFIDMLQLELDSEINGVGWCEAIVRDGKLIGLTASQSRDKCIALPSHFLRSVLEEQASRTYRGLGFFNFYWQRSVNPATLDYLKLEGENRGVVVTRVPYYPGDENPIEAGDIILKIDGFEIDSMGDYLDPQYGQLMLENLATRNHWAGEEIPMTVWRDGEQIELSYLLPKAEFEHQNAPWALYDREPEFLIAGGLVFQPLSIPYLQSWGDEWQRRAPLRLVHHQSKDASKDRQGLLVLSMVLPDPFNLGYQDYRYLAVETVNGKKPSTLIELSEALEESADGFHVIEFERGEAVRRIILDASQLQAATQRVLRRYGLPTDRVIHGTQ